jgi:hypothetical protein
MKLDERMAISCRHREIIKALEINNFSDFKGLEYKPVTLPRQEPGASSRLHAINPHEPFGLPLRDLTGVWCFMRLNNYRINLTQYTP